MFDFGDEGDDDEARNQLGPKFLLREVPQLPVSQKIGGRKLRWGFNTLSAVEIY